MDLGKAIKERRLAAGLSQRQLASRLGLTVAALWKIENNKSVPKFGTLKAICKEFCIPTAYLLNRAMTFEDYIFPGE